MNILFTETGRKQYMEWQGQDKKTIRRITEYEPIYIFKIK